MEHSKPLGYFSCYDTDGSSDEEAPDPAKMNDNSKALAYFSCYGESSDEEPPASGKMEDRNIAHVNPEESVSQAVENEASEHESDTELIKICNPAEENEKATNLELPATKKRRRTSYVLPEKQLTPQLSKYLKEVTTFWTSPHLLQRQGPPVAQSTFLKIKERILCFLGFIKNEEDTTLNVEVFKDSSVMERYFDYLKDTRGLQDATISNHASSLLYPVKYEFRSEAPKYLGVHIIAQLRSIATRLQRQGDLQRCQTRDELRARNSWLDWDEILEVLRMQRQRFDMTKTTLQKSREMMNLCLLSFYCQLPPARAKEVRTIEIFQETPTNPFVINEHKGKNVAVFKHCGDICLRYEDFKTKTSRPADQTILKQDEELTRILKEYVTTYRPNLVGKAGDTNTCKYLFLTREGQPFSSGAFTSHMQSIFQSLCGTRISVNCLRASYVTWAYESRDCTESLKDSMAAALRHSRHAAQNTYDKRTSNEKKDQAVELCRRQADEVLSGTGAVQPELTSPKCSRPKQTTFKPGDFVALVQKDSTLAAPEILVGRINHFTESGEVSLLWYRGAGKNTYKLELAGDCWIEPIDALVHVTMKETTKSGYYKLQTSSRSIHKAVLE